jgi:toxin YoeB
MAKRVVWTATAKKARREILEYWIARNGSKTYSRKLSLLFRRKIDLLGTQHYLGKPTDFPGVRATLVEYFTIFYKVKVTEEDIIIVGIWDNRRNPDDLRFNLQL